MSSLFLAAARVVWSFWRKLAVPLGFRWRRMTLQLEGATCGTALLVEPEVKVCNDGVLQIGNNVRLGKDVCMNIWPGAELIIEDDAYIGRNCIIEARASVRIGHHVMIGPFCYITDLNHGTAPGHFMRTQPLHSKPIHIGPDVWLGAGCSVLPGVTIGQGCVVGTRAVVTRDLPANAIAVGVPAVVKKFRDESPARPPAQDAPSPTERSIAADPSSKVPLPSGQAI